MSRFKVGEWVIYGGKWTVETVGRVAEVEGEGPQTLYLIRWLDATPTQVGEENVNLKGLTQTEQPCGRCWQQRAFHVPVCATPLQPVFEGANRVLTCPGFTEG